MARTLFFFFLILTAIAFGLAWLLDRPGHVVIDWQDYRIETSFAAMVIAAVLAILLGVLIFRFARWILFGQARTIEWRMRRNQEKGDKAIARGLTALAAGDAAQAAKQAQRAQGYLKNSHFVPLLQAQAARLSGDSKKAAGYYQKLAKQPETDLLGLRGLLYQALEAGDYDAARKVAAKAVALRPRTGWALNALFDLSLGARDWSGAEKATGGAVKAGLLSSDQAKRRRAILLLMESAGRRERGDTDAADKLAIDAQRMCPTLLAANIEAARALQTTGKAKRAKDLITAAWAETPHPRLAELYRELITDKTPAERVRAMEAMVDGNRDHEESRLALAEAAIDASLPGMATEVLKPLIDSPTPRAAKLMARIAEAAGDLEEERRWLSVGLSAPRADARWRCRHCGAEPQAWQPRCGHCHSFDSVEWDSPLLALNGPAAEPGWKRLSDPGLIG